MKKILIPIFLMLFLGLHLPSLHTFAQSCTQLSLPQNSFARLCRTDGGVVVDLDFSPDDKTLASVMSWPRQIVLWNIKNKTEKLTIHNTNGRSVRYSPDGKTLVCGNIVYNATTGEPKLLLLESDGYHDYVIYSPDGKTLAGAGSKGLRFWKVNVDDFDSDTVPEGDITIDVLPTDAADLTHSNDVRFTVSPIATSSTMVPGISGLGYSPDGKEVAVACGLGVWIYDVEQNKEVALFTREDGGHIDQVHSVVYSPDGNTIVSGGTGGICLWDAQTKQRKSKIHVVDPISIGLGIVTAIAISPNGDIFASGDNGSDRTHLWDTATGTYKCTLSAEYLNDVHALAFTSDGNKIASSGIDRTILLWDITAYPIVSVSTDSVTSKAIGEEIVLAINISNGNNLSGYQATIEYNPNSLEYVETQYGDYLVQGIPIQPIVNQHPGTVQLASLSIKGIGKNGDGTLATIKYKVVAEKSLNVGLRDVILSDNQGNKTYAWIEGLDLTSIITENECPNANTKDVNNDCVVSIQDLVIVATHFGQGESSDADVNRDGKVDIIDLVLVAGALGEVAAAPAAYADVQTMLSAEYVQEWLSMAQRTNIIDTDFQHGIGNLQNLLAALLPEKTTLLANYPNPFNPETWIPYQLAASADVTLTIYAVDGTLVRTLALGHKLTGLYQSRARAAYWDGKNDSGEPVASGLYFYTLTAGNFTATRKMLIRK